MITERKIFVNNRIKGFLSALVALPFIFLCSCADNGDLESFQSTFSDMTVSENSSSTDPQQQSSSQQSVLQNSSTQIPSSSSLISENKSEVSSEMGEPVTDPVYIDTGLFKRKDAYGQYTVNILGDSISHGANAPDIANQSYIGLFKQSVAKAWKGADNYGFVSLLAKFDNTCGTYTELHEVRQIGYWDTDQSGSKLGAYSLVGSEKNVRIEITPKRAYKYTAVFYSMSSEGGDFEVYIADRLVKTVSSKGKTDNTARTELIANPAGGTEKIRIVVKGNGKVSINGIGYYNNTDGVVVNNYSRGGLQLTQVSDEIISHLCTSSVVVIAMGHNDMFYEEQAEFTRKADIIISCIKANSSKVIVNDFTWGMGEVSSDHVRKELKRIADECGGIYNDFHFTMRNSIQDGSHPTVGGHILLARKLCENFSIACVK